MNEKLLIENTSVVVIYGHFQMIFLWKHVKSFFVCYIVFVFNRRHKKFVET